MAIFFTSNNQQRGQSAKPRIRPARRPGTSPQPPLLWAFAALLLLLTLVGCSDNAPPPRGETANYSAKGRVVEIANRHVRIHHEAIPQFVAADGQVVGMDAHEMTFMPADGLSVTDIAPGDKIEFAFDVWWEPLPGFELTQITKLPDDTQINLSSHDTHQHDADHAH